MPKQDTRNKKCTNIESCGDNINIDAGPHLHHAVIACEARRELPFHYVNLGVPDVRGLDVVVLDIPPLRVMLHPACIPQPLITIECEPTLASVWTRQGGAAAMKSVRALLKKSVAILKPAHFSVHKFRSIRAPTQPHQVAKILRCPPTASQHMKVHYTARAAG